MPKASEDKPVKPEALAKVVDNFDIKKYHDYPRPPDFSVRATPVNMNFSPLNFSTEKPEKSKPIPFNFILPVTNTFINKDGRAFTEPSIGFGLSAPLPVKYTGAFAIVSNNTKDAATLVAGLGAIPFIVEKGDFQANLGVSAQVVCVERGNRDKIAPNPAIGTCGLFGSIYSSVVHLPSDIGVQAIVTPAISNNQDNVFTIGAFKRF